MPKASAVKTASAPKSIGLVLIVLGAIFVISIPLHLGQGHQLVLGSLRLNYEVADTEVARNHGLSDRLNLARNDSLLFVFDTSAVQCFWMKDMHFPIDITWLDNQKRVLHTEHSLSPSTYPETFCPSAEARYVLETNAGVVDASGTHIGDHIAF
jgi:uncharacterized membrane protein (UPF0127 family)